MNRKSIILSTLFVLGLSFMADAQSFRFGIHGTGLINYVNTDDDAAKTGSSFNVGFGLLSEFRITDNYSFATGVDLITREVDLTFLDTVGAYKAGYVNIPLLLKMKSREFGYFTYFAKFGGGLSIRTSEKVTFEPGPRENVDNFIRPLNLTFAIGAGAEYSLGGSTSLVAEINYNRALVSNFSDDNSFLNSDKQYGIDYVAITIGVLF